ncbi:MAG: NAD(+) diphosphatase [Deltaproteobacteria bacterium]|nr:NAD(+) diphosphatase [Deltaproteobacteria bacterium]
MSEDCSRTSDAAEAWWFLFIAGDMIVMERGGVISVPLAANPTALGLQGGREWHLGTLDGHRCYGAEIGINMPIPDGMAAWGLRDLYEHLDKSHHRIAMKASHMIEWDRTTGFCSRCGTETRRAEGVVAKECPACGFLMFPRLSPAVIVLIERDNKLLLARARRFKADVYSVLAGFVEPGETLEETVRREIEEEVGIRVKNIRYFGSQPWPFPDSLMIGFTAEYESGEIRIEEEEIVDAGWFEPDSLPNIPGKISIARQLIDWFIEGKSKGASKTPL